MTHPPANAPKDSPKAVAAKAGIKKDHSGTPGSQAADSEKTGTDSIYKDAIANENADGNGLPDRLPANCRSPWTPEQSHFAEALNDQPSFRLEQIWRGLYERNQDLQAITDLPKKLRAELSRDFAPALQLLSEQRTSDDRTVKWLWGLPDQKSIETVLMHYPGRSTVCVSSQAGCAMACGFCATGQAGFDRNLSVGEILEQIAAARVAAEPRRLSNIVFMGMGEPLANYDRLATSLHRITSDFQIGARHITVSTIGLVPQIERLANEGLQIGLAVSLHAANDTLRTELVPVNKLHPIDELIRASRLFRETTGRRVSFEWAMISDVNDSDTDGEELAKVALAAKAHVNLIPLNPTPGWPTVGSTPDRIKRFAHLLRTAGVNVTVRANRGTDIDAACGQLAASASLPASGRGSADAGSPVTLRQQKTQ